jgi:hypothetical protein
MRHAATRDLVFVGRTDAAAGGADGVRARGHSRAPDRARHGRQDQRRSRRDLEALEHVHALSLERLAIRSAGPPATAPRRCRCRHNASSRRMPEGIRCSTVFCAADHQRVTGVVAALETRDRRPTCSVSRSTILPLPSSPHCAPMTMTTDLPIAISRRSRKQRSSLMPTSPTSMAATPIQRTIRVDREIWLINFCQPAGIAASISPSNTNTRQPATQQGVDEAAVVHSACRLRRSTGRTPTSDPAPAHRARFRKRAR